MERQFLVFRILEKAFGVPVALATYTSHRLLQVGVFPPLSRKDWNCESSGRHFQIGVVS